MSDITRLYPARPAGDFQPVESRQLQKDGGGKGARMDGWESVIILMAYCSNRNWLWIALLVLQLLLFLAGRAFDDVSWYDVGITVGTLQTFSMTFITASMFIKIGRKHFYQFHSLKETFFVLFGRSQLKFIINWSLTVLNCFLFYHIFQCLPVIEGDYFYVDQYGCGWNIAQIVTTNLLYSLAANDRCQLAEVIVYLVCIFGELIYNGSLLITFIDSLEQQQKDFGLLYIVLVITNQVLIMDLVYRFGYQKNQEEKELKHKVKEYLELDALERFHQRTFVQREM